MRHRDILQLRIHLYRLTLTDLVNMSRLDALMRDCTAHQVSKFGCAVLVLQFCTNCSMHGLWLVVTEWVHRLLEVKLITLVAI